MVGSENSSDSMCDSCIWKMWLTCVPGVSQVFPLDYILITIITMYFVVTSMAGIRNMGIWFFWIRVSKGPVSVLPEKHCTDAIKWVSPFSSFQLYKIRPKRTRPQALLFLCMILLLIVLHTSYMIYSLAPQYVMYGSQKYFVQVRKNVCIFMCISTFFVSMWMAGLKPFWSSWV